DSRHSRRSAPLLPLFFSTVPAPPEFYPLSLHDALPILKPSITRLAISNAPTPLRRTTASAERPAGVASAAIGSESMGPTYTARRSEEHTSELQSLTNLVCRLLLEKKKNNKSRRHEHTHR